MDRNLQIERYTPLVERVARQLLVRLPTSVTWEELVSAGYIGLIEAVDRFDPHRNVDFAAFARTRIRGAMLDSLRELDLLPRSVRDRINEVQHAQRQLEHEFGRQPEADEIADKLQVPLERIHEIQRYQLQSQLISFDEPIQSNEGEQGAILDRIVDEEALTGAQLIELQEINESIRAVFDTLPERLRMLVVLYYVEELTMQEISVVMSVTVGRISQLHSQALSLLRDGVGNIPVVDRRRLSLLFRASLHTDS